MKDMIESGDLAVPPLYSGKNNVVWCNCCDSGWGSNSCVVVVELLVVMIMIVIIIVVTSLYTGNGMEW